MLRSHLISPVCGVSVCLLVSLLPIMWSSLDVVRSSGTRWTRLCLEAVYCVCVVVRVVLGPCVQTINVVEGKVNGKGGRLYKSFY